MMWKYRQPVEIIFGNGSISKLKDYIHGENGLLITSSSSIKRSLDQKLIHLTEGKIKYVYYEVSSNPDIKQCQACLDMMKHHSIDFVVALGGGSVIDFAKVISVAILNNEITEWMQNHKPVDSHHLDMIAIPTTAGTGSEVTNVAVLSNHDERIKKPLSADSFYPKTALIDPELTYSVSPYITACTGFDVLCHALEAYWNKHHQPICDALSIHAIQLVLKYLKVAYEDGNHQEAREKMAEASIIAGLAFTIPKTTSAHACSYPLTNYLQIPHGEACAMTIDYFLELNDQNHDDRLLKLAQDVGFPDVSTFAEYIRILRKDVGLRSNLKDFDISSELLKQIIRDCQNPNLYNNPVSVTKQDLKELFNILGV